MSEGTRGRIRERVTTLFLNEDVVGYGYAHSQP